MKQLHAVHEELATERDFELMRIFEKEKAEGKLVPWERVLTMLKERGVRVGRRVR
jgi:hypothetical protein